ncbi:glycosidase [Spirochaetia bacterium]|nr:glycosidase [Spirochaetia bacterium]
MNNSLTGQAINLTRLDEPYLEPDYSRLVLRPFIPPPDRILAIISRISAMDNNAVREELEQVIGYFSADHGDLMARIKEHYTLAKRRLGKGNEPRDLSPEGRLLAGSYFTSEYAFEATALFNPSIVLVGAGRHIAAGDLHFIMSVRSVGEGHVSSISFRSGVIDKAGTVRLDPAVKTAVAGKREYREGIGEIRFREQSKLSERLIYPVADAEKNGIEDARFVRFTEDDGSIRYYATYTAYDGKNILPKLLETADFLRFKLLPLAGVMVINKGMALFPRKINGSYSMLSRVDGESLYIMYSNDLFTWNEATKIASPEFPWEFMQMGNCGSPLELDEGWLVLTHGVGSLRRYSISALLLDKNDPSKVIGRLREPLLSPGERERIGYVPNVVYTCGSIIHNGKLIIPYGSADRSIAFITVKMSELLEKLYRP